MEIQSHGRALAAGLILASAAPALGDDIHVEMLAPHNGDQAGQGGRGWFVDLAIRYDGPSERTGFTGLQLTGPGVHASAAPFPGTFSPGRDDRLQGLVVLVSTTVAGAGSCQNVANLFNLTGVTDRTPESTEIWDTWIVGAPNFGLGTPSTVFAAVADDHDQNGVYDDAPNVVPDADGNGICDKRDLEAIGLASNVAKADFFINP